MPITFTGREPGSVAYAKICRLHNRRVIVGAVDTGGLWIRFKRHMGGREIKVTDLRISEEAAVALIETIAEVMSDPQWSDIDHNGGEIRITRA